ncbi:hypothetical protein L1049_025632 [Liquidambar formosana]|uniref:Uncharacterized protein n=1 Tax=Liquidambar formosana TaxID=63359 RepID=A0AAP0R6J1_LIQFO
MNSASEISIATSSKRPPKRLLFDRRYGWVFDEWKDPSEEALAGGRGMFCILPLAKGLLKMASESINLATSSTVKILERPDLLSPQVFQASISDHLHKCMSSIQRPKFNLFSLEGNSQSHATSCSSHLQMERSESQIARST